MIRRTSITDFREAEGDLGGEEEESPSLSEKIAERAISRLSEKDGMTSGGGSGSATYGGARDDAHPDDEEEDEQYQKEAENGRECVDRVDESPEDAVVQYEEDEGLFFEKGDLEYVGDEDDVELDDEGEVEIPKNCRLCDKIRIAEQMVCPEHAEWIDDPEEEEYTLATEVEEAHEKAWIQLEAKRRDSLEKSEGFEKVDDELMKFYTHIVWWGGQSPDLEKSPDMWRSSEDVPEFVETYIVEAVQDGAFWQGELKRLPAGAEQHVQELFEEVMTQPQGWSLGSIVDNMQDLFPQADEDYLLTVTRNEVASLANKAREEAYMDHDDSEEFLFYWSGPEDFNTTDICSEMKDRTNPRFGGEPKPLEEMRDTLEEIARGDDDGLPGRVDEFLPHFACRHTFVRKVYL